jgi:uncharacterized protein
MGETVIVGEFEWDAEKEASNLRKHGVRFDIATAAVLDERALVEVDDTSDTEERWIHIGVSSPGVLCVVTCERWTRTRIISARAATQFEEERYIKGAL